MGKSSFVILYHRTPFDEGRDAAGNQIWVDQKSPNGIIPTLRNLFRTRDDGTWIAWRRVDQPEEIGDHIGLLALRKEVLEELLGIHLAAVVRVDLVK